MDAWKIGVSIAMTSNASAVLGVLGRDLFGMGKQAEALTSKLGLVRLAAIGAVGVIAGGAALTGMVKLVEHGKELIHQQALFKAALLDSGMSAQDMALETAKVTAAAWKNTQDVMGTGVAENLKNIRELRMVFGDTQEALSNLKVVTQAQMVMESVRGHGAGDQVFDMAKALEIKGVSMDPAHFNKLIDAMVKAAVASGGKVLGSDFFSAFKFGRTATQGWDDNFVGTILPTLIQEMKSGGGSGGGVGGPGNALQSAFQAVVGGVMSNKAADEFLRLGIVDPTKVIRTTTGAVKGIAPGGVQGASQFQADPYQWVQNVLVPALQKAGDNTPDKMREEIAHLFVNRTAQQMMTMFATQQQRFQKDATLITGAGGIDAQQALLANDPAMKMKAFTEAWQNLLTALGAPLVETAYHMLDSLTAGLNHLAMFAAAHPDTVLVIGEVTAALAALAVVMGAFAIGSAAAAALGLLTGAGGLLALAVGLEALGHALPKIPEWLVHMAAGAAVGAAAGSIVPGVGTGVGAGVGAAAGLLFSAPTGPDLNRRLRRNHPGYDANGDPVHPDSDPIKKQSYIPPNTTGQPQVQTITYVQLDGRTIAKAVSDQQAKYSNLPPAGTSAFDASMTPFGPAQQVRA